MQAMIFDIQRFSLHDGPGIRTLVFFKGCPLRCLWCSNPESHSFQPDIMYDVQKCVQCERCTMECLTEAITWEEDRLVYNRTLCTGCGSCAAVCNYNAMRIIGSVRSLAEVYREVARDRSYYLASGGGLTVGGGEPLQQAAFVIRLLRWSQDAGIHTAIETSGFTEWSRLKEASRHLDFIYYDIKQLNPVLHRHLTGVSNEIILNNLRQLAEVHSNIIIRYPLIPGCNDKSDDIEALACWVKEYLPNPVIELSPYHSYGEHKYQMLRRSYPLANRMEKYSTSELQSVVETVESYGITCRVLRR